MIVIDTHVWIWLASDPDRLSGPADQQLDAATTIGVPAVATWEVATLAAKERIRLDRPTLEWLHDALALPKVTLLPLTPAVAARSVQFSRTFPGDPADRLIAATALTENALLVTRDERIQASPEIKTVW